MEKTKENVKKSQGDKMAEKAKERNPSATYTIKSLAGNIRKLEKLKMCTPEELENVKIIYRAVKARWIALDMDI